MRRIADRNSPRLSFGLMRGRTSAALWAFVSTFGVWWGVEARWDPDVLGSKALVVVADHEFGWRE